MIRCAVCDLQQDFFNCLCSLVDSSSDDDGDSLVDAAKSVVLNGQFHVVVCSHFPMFLPVQWTELEVTVWRMRGKITTAVLCCIVYQDLCTVI